MLMVKWVVISKSTILEGCPVHFDGSEFMYGYSVAFAEDAEEAVEQVRASLLNDIKLVLQEVIECKLYREEDWQDDSDTSICVNEAYEKASQTGELAHGSFMSSDSMEEE
ncbi:hypothetical protein BTA51_08075 [Hahella sp. CCB-MM4]|uniref:hypothetical protein n=1 Tax=Hahella sp. (strain CCB-MM4) TaxID=1926491 RepID=UPI000B9B262E|nr:hypothetical protein [Hahella sp. CCB-MM4]OZG73759.1 hypothetical protein BTA51_08075 [Hahella sp. CCB-MM4]